MDSSAARRQVVIPGDVIEARGLKPGEGTFVEGGIVYAAQLGIRSEQDGYVDVIPLAGRYIPRADDEVVGQVVDLGPSHWLLGINPPHPPPPPAARAPRGGGGRGA